MAQEYQTERDFAELMAQPVGSPGLERFYGVSASPSPAATAQPQAAAPSAPTEQPSAQTTTPAPSLAPAQVQRETAAPAAPSPAFSLRGYAARETPYSGLFAPVSQGLQRGFSGIAQEAGRFSAAAGQRRSFEGIGGTGLLERAFSREAAPRDVSDAQSLIRAQYSGPRALDPGALAIARGEAEELGVRGRSFLTGTGAEDLLRTRSPGLTPGEYRTEAREILQDPLYRQAAAGFQADIGRLQAEIVGAEKAAGGLASAREAEEADIAAQSRQFAEARQREALTGIQGRLSEEEEYDDALRNLLETFRASGKLADLVALPGEEGETVAADPRIQSIKAARDKRAELEAQFADIAEIPFLEPQVTSRGKAAIGFPKEWFDANKGNYTTADMDLLRKRAMERNAAFEAAGFSPGVNRARIGGKGVLKEDFGEHAVYDPLYYGGGIGRLEPGDLRPYVGISEGTGISRETVATPEQRQAYNRASEILGLADTIAEADPRERPKIVGEIDLYLAEIERQIQERTAALGTARDEDLQGIKKARKKFEKAKKAGHWKKVAQITADVLTLGLPELAPKQSSRAEGTSGRIAADIF